MSLKLVEVLSRDSRIGKNPKSKIPLIKPLTPVPLG